MQSIEKLSEKAIGASIYNGFGIKMKNSLLFGNNLIAKAAKILDLHVCNIVIRCIIKS